MQQPVIKVAAAHAAPVFMDRSRTAKKAVALIHEAHKNGAEIVVFPESFLPGFPIWCAYRAPIDNHDFFKLFVNQSIYVDGPEVTLIRAAAQEHGIFVSFGFSEKSRASVACLWNSSILINDHGQVINHHRKLVPTFFEKMVWASGDGAGLKVCETRIGNIGGLICGENTNPLARFSLIAQQEQIHISTWPALWPTRRPGDINNFDNVAANRLRASAHSFEAKAFSIISAGYMDDTMRDMLAAENTEAYEILNNSPRAETMFVNPRGVMIGDRLRDSEGIAYANFDLTECIEPKQFHDTAGYYNRFDVFDLKVNRKRLQPVTFENLIDDIHSPQKTASETDV